MFTAAAQERVAEETVAGATWCLSAALSSGTVAFEVRQRAQSTSRRAGSRRRRRRSRDPTARLVGRLAGGIARAGNRLPALSPNPPAVAPQTDGDDGSIAGGVFRAAAVDQVLVPGLYQYLRGPWTIYRPGFSFSQYVQNKVLTVWPPGATGGAGSFVMVRFWSDAPVLQIRSFATTWAADTG